MIRKKEGFIWYSCQPLSTDVNIQQFLHYSHLFIEFLIKGSEPLVAGSCEAILTAQVLHAIDDTLIKT